MELKRPLIIGSIIAIIGFVVMHMIGASFELALISCVFVVGLVYLELGMYHAVSNTEKQCTDTDRK